MTPGHCFATALPNYITMTDDFVLDSKWVHLCFVPVFCHLFFVVGGNDCVTDATKSLEKSCCLAPHRKY